MFTLFTAIELLAFPLFQSHGHGLLNRNGDEFLDLGRRHVAVGGPYQKPREGDIRGRGNGLHRSVPKPSLKKLNSTAGSSAPIDKNKVMSVVPTATA